MKRKKEHMVHVMARTGADLVKLSSSDSPLKVRCGATGRLIAEAVLNGNGQALVPISHIRMAIDTTDGVNAILDNFDLNDTNTLRPLLFALISNLETK
ncbi:MAG: hypothetical protein PHR66_08420 [Desulfuromonadaceae bacterium]|nr:hypothetical protein [Desulfuromonadaceae bacterium]